MKILFINTIDERRKIPGVTNIPQFGTLYIASYLTAHGYKDRDIEVREWGHLHEDAFRRISPDIVGISSITQHFNIAKAIARRIKELDPNCTVVMGGFHISALPQNLTEDMDFAVIGEGEQTFLELADYLGGRGGFGDHLSIPGLAAWVNGKVVQTPPRKPIDPLDSIPPPARHKIKYDDTMTHTIVTSRGCPYHCNFCNSAAFWKTVRYHSAEYVARELEAIRDQYHPIIVSISDDLFATNKPRLRELAQIIGKRGIRFPNGLICSGRANLMDAETANLLKQIGVRTVNFGLESGSQKVLDYVKYGTVTVIQNQKAIDLVKAEGMETFGTFMMGIPGEDVHDLADTYTFIQRSGLTAFEMYMLVPFPGTDLWEEAKRRGIVSDDMDWDRFEMFYGVDSKYAVPYQDRVLVSDLDRDILLDWYAQFKALAKVYSAVRKIKMLPTKFYKVPAYIRRKVGERKRVSEIGKEES